MSQIHIDCSKTIRSAKEPEIIFICILLNIHHNNKCFRTDVADLNGIYVKHNVQF